MRSFGNAQRVYEPVEAVKGPGVERDEREPFAAVQAQVDALNDYYAAASADVVLEHAIRNVFRKEIALVSSFGADAAVLLHMIAAVDRDTPVIFLETGRHFGETLQYRDALVERFGLTNVRSRRPNAFALEKLDPQKLLYQRDPDACCALRKKNVLKKALTPFRAWISGRKRFQTFERRDMKMFEYDNDMRIKINLLTDWMQADVDQYFERHGLPRHPLWRKGYKSIGCAPCTAPADANGDARAGRWNGCGKTECGIHL